MALEIFSNLLTATLATGIDNVQTTLTITTPTSGTIPTTGNFRLRIENEYLLVTGTGNGSTTFTVTRSIEGSTAASHSAGIAVKQVITAAALAQIRLDAIAAIIGAPPVVVSNGTVSVPNATGSQTGLMTSTQAALLATATSANTANALMQRDGSGNVSLNALTANSSLTSVPLKTATGGAPNLILGANTTDGTIRAYTPSNLTVGAIVNQANSATISASTGANGSTIAQRDVNGYIYATYFNANNNVINNTNPSYLMGMSGTDGFLRWFNPAYVTVNHATSADSATSASSATSATSATNSSEFNGRSIITTSETAIGAGATATIVHGMGRDVPMAVGAFHTAAEHPSPYHTHAIGYSVNALAGEVHFYALDSSNVYIRNERSDTVYVVVSIIG